MPARTRCAIPLRHISSKTASTWKPFASCSATKVWRRRVSTCSWQWGTNAAPTTKGTLAIACRIGRRSLLLLLPGLCIIIGVFGKYGTYESTRDAFSRRRYRPATDLLERLHDDRVVRTPKEHAEPLVSCDYRKLGDRPV